MSKLEMSQDCWAINSAEFNDYFADSRAISPKAFLLLKIT